MVAVTLKRPGLEKVATNRDDTARGVIDIETSSHVCTRRDETGKSTVLAGRREFDPMSFLMEGFLLLNSWRCK